MKKLLLVIPAYNEEESIVRTISSLGKYDYIVINDGSSDNTPNICKEAGINYISLPFNEGLTKAVQTGMKYAYRNNYEYVMQFDADGQHLPEYIDLMLNTIEKDKCDIVIGSRFVDSAVDVSVRQFGASMIRKSIKLTTGKKIADPTSGMRIYNRRIMKLFAYDSSFSPEPDTLAYLIRNGADVKEVPVTMAERIAGKSYLTAWKSIKYMLKTVISILLIQFIRQRINLDRR